MNIWVRRILIYAVLVFLFNITDHALGGAIPDSYATIYVVAFATLTMLITPRKG